GERGAGRKHVVHEEEPPAPYGATLGRGEGTVDVRPAPRPQELRLRARPPGADEEVFLDGWSAGERRREAVSQRRALVVAPLQSSDGGERDGHHRVVAGVGEGLPHGRAQQLPEGDAEGRAVAVLEGVLEPL